MKDANLISNQIMRVKLQPHKDYEAKVSSVSHWPVRIKELWVVCGLHRAWVVCGLHKAESSTNAGITSLRDVKFKGN